MRVRFFALLMFGLFGAEAFANNMFIPNYYRNRRQANHFAAVGWSDRKEANLAYTVESTDTKKDGVKNNTEKKSTISPYAFYRTPVNVNLEAVVELEDEETKTTATGSKQTEDGRNIQVGVGYEFNQAPVALGLVVRDENTEEKSATGTKTKTTDTSIALGAGYRLENQMYLGLGFQNNETKTTGSPSDTSHYYSIGLGRLFGDRAKPDAAAEATFNFMNEDGTQIYSLIAKALINRDAFQFYGNANYGWTEGRSDWKIYGMTIGMDYQFADFYIGPQIDWISLESEDTTSESETQALAPSLEAGYRIEFFEAFLRYGLNSLDGESTSTTFKTKTKAEGNILTAQLVYKF